jgi:hypothetical protein
MLHVNIDKLTRITKTITDNKNNLMTTTLMILRTAADQEEIRYLSGFNPVNDQPQLKEFEEHVARVRMEGLDGIIETGRSSAPLDELETKYAKIKKWAMYQYAMFPETREILETNLREIAEIMLRVTLLRHCSPRLMS